MTRLRSNAGTRARSAQTGDGLIELVVTTMLGVLLLAGAMTLFMQSGTASGGAGAATRGEGALRAAIAALEPDIRMAGWWGLTNRAEHLAGTASAASPATPLDAQVRNNCATNWTADLARAIEARGHGYPGMACPGIRPAPWSDVLVVRRAEVAVVAAHAGTIQVQSTRAAGALFSDGAVPAQFSAAGSETHNLSVNAYYVGELAPAANGARQWALRRQRLSRTADGQPTVVDEIVTPGIEGLRVVLGLDLDGDGAADLYVSAGAAELARGRIVSVRVALTAIADEREPGPGLAAGGPATDPPAPDARGRTSLERTVALRNVGAL